MGRGDPGVGTRVLVAVGMLLLLGAVLGWIPMRTWSFEHRGHRIDVRNYAFIERVFVDGVVQRRTWVDGNYLSTATHAVTLPDGVRLRVWIGLSAGSMVCRVDDGSRVVFQSEPAAPELQGDPRPEADPRIAAARVLLADIAAVDARAASTLGASLEEAVQAEAAARSSAQAHAVLGGRPEDSAALLAGHDQVVGELLTSLRTLHLQVMSEAPSSTRSWTGRGTRSREWQRREVNATG